MEKTLSTNTFDSSPYLKTIVKLSALSYELRQAARNNSFANVMKEVDKLREYSGCFYCVKFRLDLEKNYAGVCGSCPCHKLGEMSTGRPRAYNGCYIRGPYREMVRMAWWFRQNPDAASAERLAQACEAVIKDMQDNEKVLK